MTTYVLLAFIPFFIILLVGYLFVKGMKSSFKKRSYYADKIKWGTIAYLCLLIISLGIYTVQEARANMIVAPIEELPFKTVAFEEITYPQIKQYEQIHVSDEVLFLTTELVHVPIYIERVETDESIIEATYYISNRFRDIRYIEQFPDYSFVIDQNELKITGAEFDISMKTFADEFVVHQFKETENGSIWSERADFGERAIYMRVPAQVQLNIDEEVYYYEIKH